MNYDQEDEVLTESQMEEVSLFSQEEQEALEGLHGQDLMYQFREHEQAMLELRGEYSDDYITYAYRRGLEEGFKPSFH
jgi:hypothetical protein